MTIYIVEERLSARQSQIYDALHYRSMICGNY